MKKSRILILSGNYSPEPTGIGKVNGEMVDWLSSNGHDCTVITTYPYYPFWKVQSPYTKKAILYDKEVYVTTSSTIQIYRCPHYVPTTPTGLKRIISDFSFFISAMFPLLTLLFKKKYDVIITPVPGFQLGLLGVFYKWAKKAKFVYHIHDLQIDAAKELDMIQSKSFLNTLYKMEKYILDRSDFISTVSDAMVIKIAKKCSKPIISFPNWVNTNVFFPLGNNLELRQKFMFNPEDRIILYSGAIGQKQGLEAILFAAEKLSDRNIQFLICGSGPYKEKLVKQKEKMGLKNVHFAPLRPKEELNQFLNIADVHLVLMKASADDLVMPSKLTNIFSVGGLALVSASPSSGLAKIIREHEVAILVEPDNPLSLAYSIEQALTNTNGSIKNNARNFAVQYLTINKVMATFLRDIRVSDYEPLVETSLTFNTVQTSVQTKDEPVLESTL